MRGERDAQAGTCLRRVAADEKSSAGEAGGTIFPHVDRPHLVTALEAPARGRLLGSGIMPRNMCRRVKFPHLRLPCPTTATTCKWGERKYQLSTMFKLIVKYFTTVPFTSRALH